MSFATFHPFGADLLTTLVFLPTVGALVLAFFPASSKAGAKAVGLLTSFLTFAVSAKITLGFDPATATPSAFAIDRAWIPRFGIRYQLGVDGLSLALVLLTTVLTVSLLLETGMLGSLVALDTLLFYVFWEVMLVPMYFIIGIWGGKRRIYATMKFFPCQMGGGLLIVGALLSAARV